MCGLVGFLDPRAGMAQQALDATAGDMAATLVSRGPDGRGVWADGAAGGALADPGRSGVRPGREILRAEEDFQDGGDSAANNGHDRPALSDALR